MMQIVALLAHAIFAGALLPIQTGVNSQMAKALGNPLWGALASFGVGTIALVLFAVLTGVKFPGPMQISAAPGWLWTGGLMGAFYVATAVILAPRLGAATTISLFVAGQMATSLILDHYGLISFPVHPMNAWRILGGALIIAGVILVRMF